ncbi:MAG: alanine racemase [Acidobacteria bacterium]|jgi:alanine racemase|nr:alanine racemase [Acidobacteriota bacterium]
MTETLHDSQWIELDAAALRKNLAVFRRVLGSGVQLAAVVKANAYGHGLAEVAPLVATCADWLAVHSANEARSLRALRVDLPVLVMGFVTPSDLEGLDSRTHVFASTLETLSWVGECRRRCGVSLPVHLKVETGTNRQGLRLEDLSRACRVAAEEGVKIVGAATHFANIEDTLEHEFAQRQLEEFRNAVGLLSKETGGPLQHVHAACSAAALLFREADFTMVRVGISAYGHWPSRETQLSWILEHGRNGLGLTPVLSWKTRVGQIKRVPEGETVGYGRTWRALRPTVLAVLPVGYADGYPRSLGNRARVLVGGVPAPVVGRVCMNITLVDVTDVPGVSVGDEVVLLGSTGDACISAEELGSLSGSINYEILARLSPLIPRRVVNTSP